jgi:hypothetical protein
MSSIASKSNKSKVGTSPAKAPARRAAAITSPNKSTKSPSGKDRFAGLADRFTKKYNLAVAEDNPNLYVRINPQGQVALIQLSNARRHLARAGNADFVYQPDTRAAGDRALLRDALTNLLANGVFKNLGMSVNELMQNVIDKRNYADSPDWKEAVAFNSEERENKKTAAGHTSVFPPSSWENLRYAIVNNLPKQTKEKKAAGQGAPVRGGLVNAMRKARIQRKDLISQGKQDKARTVVVNVSQLQPLGNNGRGVKATVAKKKESLKGIPNVGGWLIYSDNADKFDEAIRLLMKDYPDFGRFLGKWGQTMPAGTLAPKIDGKEEGVPELKETAAKSGPSEIPSTATIKRRTAKPAAETEEIPKTGSIRRTTAPTSRQTSTSPPKTGSIRRTTAPTSRQTSTSPPKTNRPIARRPAEEAESEAPTLKPAARKPIGLRKPAARTEAPVEEVASKPPPQVSEADLSTAVESVPVPVSEPAPLPPVSVEQVQAADVKESSPKSGSNIAKPAASSAKPAAARRTFTRRTVGEAVAKPAAGLGSPTKEEDVTNI